LVSLLIGYRWFWYGCYLILLLKYKMGYGLNFLLIFGGFCGVFLVGQWSSILLWSWPFAFPLFRPVMCVSWSSLCVGRVLCFVMGLMSFDDRNFMFTRLSVCELLDVVLSMWIVCELFPTITELCIWDVWCFGLWSVLGVVIFWGVPYLDDSGKVWFWVVLEYL